MEENDKIIKDVMALYEQHKLLQIEYENNMMVLMEKNANLKKGRVYTNTSLPHENYNLLVRYELDQSINKVHKFLFINPSIRWMRSMYFCMVFKKWTKKNEWSTTTIKYDFKTAESIMEEPKCLPKQIERKLHLDFYEHDF